MKLAATAMALLVSADLVSVAPASVSLVPYPIDSSDLVNNRLYSGRN